MVGYFSSATSLKMQGFIFFPLVIVHHAAATIVFYVSPYPTDNGVCTGINGSNFLSPCYQFHQLNSRILSNYEEPLHLSLLPGTHSITRNSTFEDLNTRELKIYPYSEDIKGVMNCQTKVNLTFKNIAVLLVDTIIFSSCTMNFIETHRLIQASINITRCTFTRSLMNYPITVENISAISITACKFNQNNGAILAYSRKSSNLITLNISHTSFKDNHRTDNGGMLQVERVYLLLFSSNFTGNVASSGSAVQATLSQLFVHKCQFITNYASISGGAIYSLLSRVTIDSSHFWNNSAMAGGAIYSLLSTITIDSSHFLNNSAGETGGAIHTKENRGHIVLNGTYFTSNQASESGGVIYCETAGMVFLSFRYGRSYFNSATRGGFAYLSRCFLNIVSEYAIINQTALVSGGAIYAFGSVIHFNSAFCNLTQNTAGDKGGALYLHNSNIFFRAAANIIFLGNSVTSLTGRGGAIFNLDEDCDKPYGPGKICFIYGENLERKSFIFVNNTAAEGSVLYGGLLDRCQPDFIETPYPSGIALRAFKKFSQYEPSPLAITSETVRLCLCSGGRPNCDHREIESTKMRGEVLSLILAAVDQNSNPVVAYVKASYKEISAQVEQGEDTQQIANRCEELEYFVYSLNTTATLVLQPEGPCGQSPFSSIIVNIIIKQCPIGFEQSSDKCICDRRLLKHQISDCDINTYSVKTRGLIWLRYDEDYLKIHNNCPLDYCETTSDAISLTYPDTQCANHRSGVLCGACQQNYTIALGSSKCLQCTSKYTFIWLILMFVLAGVVLVAFLLVCNLTVSAGTLNGLIFYANLVSISGLTSFRTCSIHPILSVFIAWVNLDLGIETCFYSGLDTYYKAWLQFVFPLYVWLLAGVMILASYYSSKAMKVFGRNNVAILATLFLLSYTKILKTIVEIFTFSRVLMGKVDDVTDQLTPHNVWTYDGNVDYLKGKHILLFVMALIFLLVFFLPYTLALIFGQYLYSLSPSKGLKRIHSMISILDAYHAPYNKKHRYWTGLMLLIRCLLFLVFVTNFNKDALVTSMYAVTLTVAGLLTVKAFSKTRMYKKVHNNLLELFFLLNLETLTVTLHYLKGKGSGAAALCHSSTVSVGVSFTVFCGILVYHTYLQVKNTHFWALFKMLLLGRFFGRGKNHLQLEEFTDNDDSLDVVEKVEPSSTTIMLGPWNEKEETD